MKALDPTIQVERLRQAKDAKGKHGKTVTEIIELRIDWMKHEELKANGEKRPRIESWSDVASHLRRFVSERP